MRYAWLLLIPVLCAYKPLKTTYESYEEVGQEIRNIEKNVQGRQFTVVDSTPNLTDLQDGEVVIFSSGTTRLMFRNGQEIYSVNVSCVTVYR